jgi:hypothetical protein
MIVGHSRVAVYASNMTVCIVAAMVYKSLYALMMKILFVG